VESAKRTCERIIFKICHATPRAKKEGRRGEGGRGTTGTNGYRTVSPIVNGDSVFTRHEFYNSFTVTWLSEFRAPLKPPFPSSRPLLHLPPPPRWPDTRAGRYAYVRVALLVLFRGMHNARRGEFTLPMANRKSSANIRQETFFRLGRLSPFLEKCVDESPLCGSQGIAELPYPGATYSFISACICGWRFDCPRRHKTRSIHGRNHGVEFSRARLFAPRESASGLMPMNIGGEQCCPSFTRMRSLVLI